MALSLSTLGDLIAARRKSLGLSQSALAHRASIGLSTLEALENSRMGELGYSKITRCLAALGLELKVQEASTRRPTLDDLTAELMAEDHDDQNLDRRR